jgi:hypothetical protein
MFTGRSYPLDHIKPIELETDNETAEVEIDLQLSMQEKLARAIDKDMNFKISSKSRATTDVTIIVKKELAFFEVKDKRGANLESCYENLNSIPESIFCQDVEELLPKLDHHVNMLTFLRGYFKTENNCLLTKQKDCQFKFLCLYLIFTFYERS